MRLRVIRKGYGFPSIFNADARGGGAAPPGQDAGRRPRRRLQRLRGGGGLRQGGLHPHRLLQPGEDPGAGPARRRRSADGQAARAADRRARLASAASTTCSPPSGGSCTTSSRSRSAATSSSSGCTPTRCPRRSSRVLTDDCIAKGKDYNAGGARYNNTFIQFVGIGSLTDCLGGDQATGLRRPGPIACRAWSRPSTPISRARSPSASGCSTARTSTATTTTDADRSDGPHLQRAASRRSTAGRTPRAGATAWRCCPPPATSTSAR